MMVESPTRHNPAVGIMTKLMHRGPVKVYGFKIGLRPRDLNEIIDRAVESAIATDAEVGTGRGDQRFGVRQDEAFSDARGGSR